MKVAVAMAWRLIFVINEMRFYRKPYQYFSNRRIEI